MRHSVKRFDNVKKQNTSSLLSTPLRRALGLPRSASTQRILWEFGLPPAAAALTGTLLQSFSRSCKHRKRHLVSLPYHDYNSTTAPATADYLNWMPHKLRELSATHRHIDMRNLSRSAVSQIVLAEQKQLWSVYCRSRPYAQAVKSDLDIARYMLSDTTRVARIRARLRLGVARTRHFLHKTGRVSSPNCVSCGVADDEAHVLIFCTALAEDRLHCVNALGTLSPPVALCMTALLGIAPPGHPQFDQILHATSPFLCILATKKRI